MIAATDRGLFVTRFHYVNVSEPMKTVLTGMTRDGTFLIEGGKLTKPVRNLRFTQSVLEALASADMISADTKVVDGDCRVPALRARSFRFSGATVDS
jgi:predicted Zn-dependent protease